MQCRLQKKKEERFAKCIMLSDKSTQRTADAVLCHHHCAMMTRWLMLRFLIYIQKRTSYSALRFLSYYEDCKGSREQSDNKGETWVECLKQNSLWDSDWDATMGIITTLYISISRSFICHNLDEWYINYLNKNVQREIDADVNETRDDSHQWNFEN